MVQEIIQAFLLIFIAEMGDKTQILAMAFATKYSVKKVLLGIGIGSFLNHGLAVALGSQLVRVIPMNWIQVVAGLAFVVFGIWSLRIEEEEEEEVSVSKHGPVLTVALAFFIGELGDKTQLTAITLAAGASYPAFILVGTVAGMLTTGGLGIYVGKKIGDKVPEIAINIAASTIFLIFGSIKLYNALPGTMIVYWTISIYVLVIGGIFTYLTYRNYKAYKKGFVSQYRSMSGKLYAYYQHLDFCANELCLGKNRCGHCDGLHCPVGNTKAIINQELKGQESVSHGPDIDISRDKAFNREMVEQIIKNTEAIKDHASLEEREQLDKILHNMRVASKHEK